MSDFACAKLPDPIRRDSKVDPKYHTEGYMERLDRDTLWYDAFWSDGVLTLVGPPLHNLRDWFDAAALLADGTPLKQRRFRKFAKYMIVEYEAKQAPTVLRLEAPNCVIETSVNIADHDRFAGQNVSIGFNKNNRLEWLVDYARFHRDTHGLQAMVIFDNESDQYCVADIYAALETLGLNVLVMSAPFKWAPKGKKPRHAAEKFMQPALYNVGRLRFLQKAHAVLVTDFDELVRTNGPSVFDVAAASRSGFVQFPGVWHYPAPGAEPPVRHADHIYTKSTPEKCPPKYCISPSGFMGNLPWDVHGPTGLAFKLLRRFPHKDFEFLHCRSIATGWRPRQAAPNDDPLVVDPKAKDALRVLND